MKPIEYKYTKTAAEPHLDMRETLVHLDRDKLIGLIVYLVRSIPTMQDRKFWSPEDVFLDCLHNYIQIIATEEKLEKDLDKLISDLNAIEKAERTDAND